MPRVAIILVHRGKGHKPSRQILEKIEKSGVKGITEIHVRSAKLREWLTHNSHKLEINDFPSFLLAQEGKRTEVYPGSEVETIIGMINELTS